jgi:ABC-type transport system substrate-binding protein
MTDISNWYLGFNMLDPVVGKGDTPEQAEKNRKLRQAIAIAIDWEEGYGRIFKHKGGVAAHGPAAAGAVRLARRAAGFPQPGHARMEGRQGGAPAHRGARKLLWPRPATPAGATPRPASRWC